MVYIWLIVGFVLLIKGADYFVEGSSSVAKLLRIPSVIIGLTVVAFGTSAPEAAVSITAAVNGNNGIAVGNVIGSNIFNLLVVVGIGSMVRPIAADKKIMYGDFIYSIVISVVLLVMIAFDLQTGRVDGLILLGLFVYFMYFTVKSALKNRISSEEKIDALSPVRSTLYIILGMTAIIMGGNLVVDGATQIAETFGLSQNLIGLTIVAMGTSLPELVTSVVAAYKGENGLALGNAIGSNIFNILMVLAVSSVIKPITVSVASVYDLICLIVFSLIAWVITRTSMKVTRAEGLLMVVMYAGYMTYIIVR
ncbi:calcium/sodium antiporter [Clostridium sp. AM58-1XD]|uniref:calcium/sodium antiporter n=1 Tax=Clostridium sp. AM58-1XD TaxID=2292307 RepID=UPI000E4B009A|nr:calcium/sodium antiporter [Clostridium sp. AM58-1XD]RGY98903.1 sodium:calcium antiporter [Clostridium sp. AM58-1XD]